MYYINVDEQKGPDCDIIAVGIIVRRTTIMVVTYRYDCMDEQPYNFAN